MKVIIYFWYFFDFLNELNIPQPTNPKIQKINIQKAIFNQFTSNFRHYILRKKLIFWIDLHYS